MYPNIILVKKIKEYTDCASIYENTECENINENILPK